MIRSKLSNRKIEELIKKGGSIAKKKGDGGFANAFATSHTAWISEGDRHSSGEEQGKKPWGQTIPSRLSNEVAA